jgi:hypothetical protein
LALDYEFAVNGIGEIRLGTHTFWNRPTSNTETYSASKVAPLDKNIALDNQKNGESNEKVKIDKAINKVKE